MGSGRWSPAHSLDSTARTSGVSSRKFARGAAPTLAARAPAFCFACHSHPILSPVLAVEEPRFAGCINADPDPHDSTKEFCAPNLTPDPETGWITNWSEEDFVDRMKSGRGIDNSSMPWENYLLMTDADLRSIYRYLRTLPPARRNTGPSHRPVGWKPE